MASGRSKTYKGTSSVASGERDRPIMPPRKCHDCGAETYDYRCPKCRKEFMIKCGVSSKAVVDPSQVDMSFEPDL